jgi:hypothetical protein
MDVDSNAKRSIQARATARIEKKLDATRMPPISWSVTYIIGEASSPGYVECRLAPQEAKTIDMLSVEYV